MNIREKRKSNKSLFKKVYIIFFSLLVAAIIFSLFLLWNALADYEATVPENLLTNITNNLKNDNLDEIINNTDLELNEFESKDDFKAYLQNAVNEKEVEFSKQAVSDTQLEVYNIKAGDQQVLTVSLKKQEEKSKFGFEEYKVEKISCSTQSKAKAVINAPSNAKVYLNEKLVADSYIKQSGLSFEELAYIPDEFNKPEIVKYQIDGLLNEGTVTATGYLGNELSVIKNEKTGEYDVIPQGVQENSGEFDELITNVALAYSKYVTNDVSFSEVGKYINSDSLIYKAISSMEVHWYSSHEKYEFKNIKTFDFKSYSDDIVSYRISFDHYVYRISAGKTFHYPCDYTIVFAKKNNNWMVYDIIINSGNNI